MPSAKPAATVTLSPLVIGRLAWAALWWAIALGALWQLAKVVL